MIRLFPFLLLAACASPAEHLQCEAMAIKDADGNPDPCDLDACLACERACDDSCVSLEIGGPGASNYHCEADVWTARDFCPDWGSGQ